MEKFNSMSETCWIPPLFPQIPNEFKGEDVCEEFFVFGMFNLGEFIFPKIRVFYMLCPTSKHHIKTADESIICLRFDVGKPTREEAFIANPPNRGENKKSLKSSGQISIIPKPELRGFWGSSLIKPPFRVTSADVAIICPEIITYSG